MKTNATWQIQSPRKTLDFVLLNERVPCQEEQKIVDFLNHGIAYVTQNIANAVRSGKFETASQEQHKAIVLQGVVDAILAGFHDSTHPFREIIPKKMSEDHFTRL